MIHIPLLFRSTRRATQVPVLEFPILAAEILFFLFLLRHEGGGETKGRRGKRLLGLGGSRELVGRRRSVLFNQEFGGEMMMKKKNNKGRHDFLRRSCLV